MEFGTLSISRSFCAIHKLILLIDLFCLRQDTRPKTLPAPDDVIQETDVRYWMLETQEPHDIESFLVDNPNNTHLWMKLAYKKLSASNGFVKFPIPKKKFKTFYRFK